MKPQISTLLFTLAFATASFAQNDKNDPLKNAVESKQYIFKARTVMPATGGTRQLTSGYDLTVRNDSVIAYLPYFGRAYQASIGKTTDGINFTSTDFSYNVNEGRKGGWLIEIKPKDGGDVQMLNLNISRKGYGTLHVNNQNRQSISFSGKIEPLYITRYLFKQLQHPHFCSINRYRLSYSHCLTCNNITCTTISFCAFGIFAEIYCSCAC